MSELRQAKYELISGVTVSVTPVTALMQRAIHARVALIYPEPDRSPFETVIEMALVPGTKTNAEHSPEWLGLMQKVIGLREQAYIGLLLDSAVTVPDRDALTAPYQQAIDAFKRIVEGMPASAAIVSDFVALLLGVLAESEEVSALVKLAQGATPLTETEIINGYRMFRGVDIQRAGRPNHPRKPESQNLQAAQLPEARPADDGIRGSGEIRDDSGRDLADRSRAELVHPAP